MRTSCALEVQRAGAVMAALNAAGQKLLPLIACRREIPPPWQHRWPRLWWCLPMPPIAPAAAAALPTAAAAAALTTMPLSAPEAMPFKLQQCVADQTSLAVAVVLVFVEL